jgi:hypothetical protein
MINRKLRNTMLMTAIIGTIATIAFVIFFDTENFKILLLPVIFYILEFFIIGYGFRWKFGNKTGLVGMLCFSPLTFELFGFLFIDSLLSEEIAIGFIEWFSMIGVTISVLIFEYKFATHNKK